MRAAYVKSKPNKPQGNDTTSAFSGNWEFLEPVKDRQESDGLSQVFEPGTGPGEHRCA